MVAEQHAERSGSRRAHHSLRVPGRRDSRGLDHRVRARRTRPQRGDKPAIIDGPTGRTLTYAQLVDAVRRVAAGLAAHGFAKGDVLGIYSPNVPEYAVAFHAAASLGGISYDGQSAVHGPRARPSS